MNRVIIIVILSLLIVIAVESFFYTQELIKNRSLESYQNVHEIIAKIEEHRAEEIRQREAIIKNMNTLIKKNNEQMAKLESAERLLLENGRRIDNELQNSNIIDLSKYFFSMGYPNTVVSPGKCQAK